MIIKESDLKFEKFNILACSFAATPPNRKIPENQLKSNDTMFDFDILFNKKNRSRFKILLQLESNNTENPRPGYIFSIICESYFNLKGASKLDDNKKDQFVFFTALPLAVAMVRSHIYNLSANYPYGHYLLPSIDLRNLLDKKFKKELKS